MKKIILITSLLLSTMAFGQKQSGDPIMAKDFNSSTFNVGSVQQAMLTETQFQSLNGSCWVQIKGQSVAGTDYATITGITTLPDARGYFLRNAGPGAAALGQLQQDAFQGHWHTSYHRDGAGQLGGTNAVNTAGYNGVQPWGGTIATATATVQAARNDGANGDPRVANETRPKNLTINTFIKVSKICNF